MTAEEFLKENIKPDDRDKLKNRHNTLWADNVIIYMEEYAKQKAIQALTDGTLKIVEEAKVAADTYSISHHIVGIQFGMGLAAGTLSKLKDSL